jgi:hypothetical protein
MRAPVGEGFPSLPFRLCRAGSQFRHGSRYRKPPSHPGRSDFPSPVGSHGFPRSTFQVRVRSKHSPACTPTRIC